jgi:hypothetical protein
MNFMKMHKRMKKAGEVTEMVNTVLRMDNLEDMHQALDGLLNTVNIMYESRKDFEDNFPAKDDLQGKVELLVTRRK